MPSVFRPAPDVRATLQQHFPNLRFARWSIKSPWNDTYKCIAWTACRTDVSWWPPGGTRQIYWPPGARFDDSIDAFIEAFAKIGYKPCDNSEFEFWYQKVAIYAASNRSVQHMARQHFWGRGWLSKLGKLEDITHADLECIEGDPSPIAVALHQSYGRVAQILKRSWWDSVVNFCLFRCLWGALKFWLYRLRHPSWILDNLITNRSSFR